MRGVALQILEGSLDVMIPWLTREIGATVISWNSAGTPLWRRRDERVAAAVSHAGEESIAVDDHIVFGADEIKTQSGGDYSVYTPSRNARQRPATLRAGPVRRYADGRVGELERHGLDGFVVKKDSPSCGMSLVRVYQKLGGTPNREGVGQFVQVLTRCLPELPLEEERRLRDSVLREHFIEEIFSQNRWLVLLSRGLTRRSLIAFHEGHKMLILAHDQEIYREPRPREPKLRNHV